MMPARQVSGEEFKVGMNREQVSAADAALSAGLGLALYADDYGVASRLIVTWGSRQADLPGYPPAAFGGRDLRSFVSPHQEPAAMVSPALRNRDVVPQIARPRVSPSRTFHPDEYDMRTRQGNVDFLDANRFTPGGQVEEVLQEPEEESWWRSRLR